MNGNPYGTPGNVSTSCAGYPSPSQSFQKAFAAAQQAAHAARINAAMANPPMTAVLPDPPKGFWDWAVDEWTTVVVTAVGLGGLTAASAYAILCAWLMGWWSLLFVPGSLLAAALGLLALLHRGYKREAIRKYTVARMGGDQ